MTIKRSPVLALALGLLFQPLDLDDLTAQSKPRARDLGIPLDGTPGPLNAITDVPGVEVGYATLVSGRGQARGREGPGADRRHRRSPARPRAPSPRSSPRSPSATATAT